MTHRLRRIKTLRAELGKCLAQSLLVLFFLDEGNRRDCRASASIR
jgi:hypothetical protein